jgi:Tol biopolymer transport system component
LLALAATALLATGGGAEGATRAESAESILTNDAPTWSPDGRRIAFTSFRNGRGEIYAMNANGRQQRRLTRNPAHDDHPAWSPDGRRIAFSSTRSGNFEIFVMNADGSRTTRLTRSQGNDYLPTWSADSSRIAWASYRDGNAEIYVMNADGTDQRRLTNSPRADTSPDWAADGRIAFVSTRNGINFNAYVMNQDGSKVVRVTESQSNHEQPDWSPDGSEILFVNEREGTLGPADIFAIRPDGTGTRRITESEGRDDWPAWSPDGRRILFTRGLTFRTPEIFVANADGSRAVRLTTSGPQLEIVEAAAVPVWPTAGRRWTTAIGVEDVRGAPLGRGSTPLCAATIGRTPLRALVQRASAGVVRCAWQIPRNARGRQVRGAIGLRLGQLRVELPFALTIR